MAKGFRRTWSGRLRVIEEFARTVAQKVLGGKITLPNDPRGDLYHSDTNSFSEVKAANRSGGALIRELQLVAHHEDEKFGREYAFVFYINREWTGGRYRYLTMRSGRTRALLQEFLSRQVREIHVLDISIVWAFYLTHPERMKEHEFKEGYRRYFKMYPAEIQRFADDIRRLSELGLDSDLYESACQRKIVRLGDHRIPLKVQQIVLKSVVEDDSFDVSSFEVRTA